MPCLFIGIKTACSPLFAFSAINFIAMSHFGAKFGSFLRAQVALAAGGL
jgi:hypothetical protein